MKVDLEYIVARLNSIKVETSDEYTRERISKLIEEIKKGIPKGSSKVKISLYYDKYELLDAIAEAVYDDLCEEEFDEEQCNDIANLVSDEDWKRIYDKVWKAKGREIKKLAYDAFEEDLFDSVIEKLIERKSLYSEIKRIIKEELIKRIR